ncbi:MAG: hypothetical protein KBS41_04675 [Oscillospiraceae bacterium]|nr:hypothetical protein [Candidatus Equicaccousia limihippi]
MDRALLGVYATLHLGFHKPCADTKVLFEQTKDIHLLKKAEKIIEVCKEKNITVHPTKRPDLPPVLYIKGNMNFGGKIVGVCGPSRLDDQDKARLFGAVTTANALGCTVISGTLGESETLTHQYGNNTVVLLHSGDFDGYDNAISEFYPGTPPLKPYFNFKNELLCLLSDIIIYTKEEKESRSLYTKTFAQKLNKNIITLKEDDTFILPPAPAGLTGEEQIVYGSFTAKVQDYDVLKIRTGLDDSILTAAIFSLIIKGVLKELPLSRYEMVL